MILKTLASKSLLDSGVDVRAKFLDCLSEPKKFCNPARSNWPSCLDGTFDLLDIGVLLRAKSVFSTTFKILFYSWTSVPFWKCPLPFFFLLKNAYLQKRKINKNVYLQFLVRYSARSWLDLAIWDCKWADIQYMTNLVISILMNYL